MDFEKEEANYYLKCLAVLMFYGAYIVSDQQSTWLQLDHDREQELLEVLQDNPPELEMLDVMRYFEGRKMSCNTYELVDKINSSIDKPLVLQWGDTL